MVRHRAYAASGREDRPSHFSGPLRPLLCSVLCPRKLTSAAAPSGLHCMRLFIKSGQCKAVLGDQRRFHFLTVGVTLVVLAPQMKLSPDSSNSL